jgi:hypothetical protein
MRRLATSRTMTPAMHQQARSIRCPANHRRSAALAPSPQPDQLQRGKRYRRARSKEGSALKHDGAATAGPTIIRPACGPAGRTAAARSGRQGACAGLCAKFACGAAGLAMYSGTGFPENYRGGAFVGEHRSWYRNPLNGFNVCSCHSRTASLAARLKCDRHLTCRCRQSGK